MSIDIIESFLVEKVRNKRPNFCTSYLSEKSYFPNPYTAVKDYRKNPGSTHHGHRYITMISNDHNISLKCHAATFHGMTNMIYHDLMAWY